MSPRSLTRGLRRLFLRAETRQDLDNEVAHYLEMAAAEYVRAGLAPDEAARRARVDFGGVEAAKEGVRSAGWDGALDTLRRDIAYGVRALRRSPGFTIVALITLALGIGANTAMFSVVNAVALRPLPYRDQDRLAMIWTDDTRRGLHRESTAFRTIEDWRAENQSFQGIAFYTTARAMLRDGIRRERSRGALVSANLFATLGVGASLGRTLTIDDETKAARVAVISHSLWQRWFAGDSNVIGRTLETEGGKDGGVVRIVGVMPAGFYFPDKQVEIWTPATTYWRWGRESGERFAEWARRWNAIGRLRPNASIADARADLGRIGAHLSATYPPTVPDFPGFRTTVAPVLDQIAGTSLRSTLWVLLGAVGLVLLIACANVANLLLARGAARQQEFAIRHALGAGRGRIIRQLAVESIVLAIAGGALGMALAVVGTRLFAVVAATQLPRMDEMSVDGSVLLFAAAVSIVAGIVFGMLPAIRVSAPSRQGFLKQETRSTGGPRARRTSGMLVVAECSLAIVLLAGAGLLLKSLDRLRATDPGFDPSGVLSVRMMFPPEATTAERLQPLNSEVARAHNREQTTHDLIRRVAGLPGVDAVGFIDDMFIGGQPSQSITIPGRVQRSLATGELNEASVTPEFFSMMHVPLREGRYLTREDVFTKIRALWAPVNTSGSLADKERLSIPEPVVVNETFVHRFFPGESPIGKRFCIDPTNKTYWYVIVGVVGDMRRQGLERRAIPEYFGAYFPVPSGRADLLVRTHGDPLAFASNVRQAVSLSVPGALIDNVSTADRQLGNFSAQRDFQTLLLTAFAALALVLAAVGIYGVVHYAVAERTREIGVRIALGATPADVMRLVMGQGMRTPMAGILVGLGAAFAGTRLLSSLLFGIGATDPATFAAVAGGLALVALAACYFPARRATRVDAVQALRRE